MPSKVQIANIALGTYLGKGRINSLDERTPEAQQIDIHYDEVRREILSEWSWHFVTRRDVLARVTVNDKPEWASKFALPAKTLLLRWVNDPQSAKDAISQREVYDTARLVQGGFIYSDLEEATAEFVGDFDDPTVYPPKFTQAFAALLASRIAVPLTETANKASAAASEYDRLLDEAKVQDIQMEMPIRIIATVDWARAR